jgi:hypothetical protein
LYSSLCAGCCFTKDDDVGTVYQDEDTMAAVLVNHDAEDDALILVTLLMFLTLIQIQISFNPLKEKPTFVLRQNKWTFANCVYKEWCFDNQSLNTMENEFAHRRPPPPSTTAVIEPIEKEAVWPEKFRS